MMLPMLPMLTAFARSPLAAARLLLPSTSVRMVADHRITSDSSKHCQEKDAAILFEALNADDGVASKAASTSSPGGGGERGERGEHAGKDRSAPSAPSNQTGGKGGKGKNGRRSRRVAKAADKKALDRREFLQAMIHLAVMRFVKSGEEVRSVREELQPSLGRASARVCCGVRACCCLTRRHHQGLLLPLPRLHSPMSRSRFIG